MGVERLEAGFEGAAGRTSAPARETGLPGAGAESPFERNEDEEFMALIEFMAFMEFMEFMAFTAFMGFMGLASSAKFKA